MEKTCKNFQLNTAAIPSKTTFSKSLSNFFSSDLFIAFFTAVIYCLSFVKQGGISLSVVSLIIAAVFFTQKDLKCLFSPFMMTYFGMPFLLGGRFDFNVFTVISLSLLVISVVYYILKRRPKLKFTKNILLLIPYAAAYPLGGWFANENLTNSTFYALSLGLAVVLTLAFLFFALLAGNSDLSNKEYIFKIIFATGVLITMQIFTTAIFTPDFWDVVASDTFMLNWGIYNGVITAMLFAVPTCFYFALKRTRKTLFFIIIAFAETIATFLTGSRAGIICMPFVLVFCFLLAIKFSIGQLRRHVITIFCSVAIAIVTAFMVTLIVSPEVLNKLFKGFYSSGLSSNGRTSVWLESLELFKSSPVFGVGLFHSYGNSFGLTNESFWLSHNTVYQALSSLGIVGFIGLWIHTESKYYSCRRNNAFTAFIALMFLLTEAYGMIDCLMPAPYYIMPLISLLILLDVNPQRHSEALPVAKIRVL